MKQSSYLINDENYINNNIYIYIMDIFTVVITFIWIVLIFIAFRAHKVLRFFNSIVDKAKRQEACFYELCTNNGRIIDTVEQEYDLKLMKTYESLVHLPFVKMVFSLKPLTYEKWLSKEQISFLKLEERLFKKINVNDLDNIKKYITEIRNSVVDAASSYSFRNSLTITKEEEIGLLNFNKTVIDCLSTNYEHLLELARDHMKPETAKLEEQWLISSFLTLKDSDDMAKQLFKNILK